MRAQLKILKYVILVSPVSVILPGNVEWSVFPPQFPRNRAPGGTNTLAGKQNQLLQTMASIIPVILHSNPMQWSGRN